MISIVRFRPEADIRRWLAESYVGAGFSLCWMRLSNRAKIMNCVTRGIGTRIFVGSGFGHPRRSQNPERTFCSDCAGKDLGNDDAVLGCQPEGFGGCYAQRVCHSVEIVDLEHVDLGVAFDDIRHCLHNLASVLGFELALHATQVFAQIR